ncbi:hypothetical protein HY11_12925 [Hyphomonas pacifica]|nr:hypothetical protein HY11_12925 [Hyphomonas pacifica]
MPHFPRYPNGAGQYFSYLINAPPSFALHFRPAQSCAEPRPAFFRT